ncbi:hypothetical protein STAQ_13730 [Allostella sp. ATCC 35155]|nr:hypothetical protein STAQ_13730 [Stella sp. ATCC 35155]
MADLVGPTTVNGGIIFGAFIDDDVLNGSDAADSIRGGAGDDTIFGRGGNDQLFGDNHDDWLNGNIGEDLLRGDNGDDTLLGGQGQDYVYGEFGNDFANGNIGNDNVFGSAGNDTLHGGQGMDFLFAGSDDDFLSGDRDNDTLQGGVGADRFFFTAAGGIDRIDDYEPGFDRILVDVENGAINGSPVGSIEELIQRIVDTDDGAFVPLGTSGEGVYLVGVTKAELSAADFELV